jgi:hypothetical protein
VHRQRLVGVAADRAEQREVEALGAARGVDAEAQVDVLVAHAAPLDGVDVTRVAVEDIINEGRDVGGRGAAGDEVDLQALQESLRAGDRDGLAGLHLARAVDEPDRAAPRGALRGEGPREARERGPVGHRRDARTNPGGGSSRDALREAGLDRGDHGGVVGPGGRGEPDDLPAVGGHDELLEVPANVAAVARGVGDVGELLVDRVASGAVDVDLLGHREADAVGGAAERLDLLGGARLLRAELVAREADDGEPARAVLGLQRLEGAVLRGQAAAAGDVHEQEGLAAVRGEARRSIVHSMVEFVDGSILAQLGVPSMTVPIRYALAYPRRAETREQYFDLARFAKLTFEAPDDSRFPALRLGHHAAAAGGLAGCALNAANEVAVERFLARKISFSAIPEIVERVLDRVASDNDPDLEQILATDAWARENAAREIERLKA